MMPPKLPMQTNHEQSSLEQTKPRSANKYKTIDFFGKIIKGGDSTKDQSNQLSAKNKKSQIEEDYICQIQHLGQATIKVQNKSPTSLKQLFPFQIDEIIVEIAQADLDYESEAESVQQKQIKRVKQSLCLYIVVIICSLITATQNLYIFLGTLPYRDVAVTFPTLIVRIILLPIATYKLCSNWRVFLRLMFMIDKVMLAGILQYVGVMGFILIFIPYTPSAWFYQCLFVLYPIYWLIYIANFRVNMVYCDWTKVQTLIYKITLLIGSTSYFILGVYYLVSKLKFTRGLSPQLDESIENLLLIYINAGFQVYLEMIARMDSVDGSVSFKMDYRLHCDPEDMEQLLKGRKQNVQESDSSDSEPSDDSDSINIDDLTFSQVESEYERRSKSRKSSVKRMSQNNSRKPRQKIVLSDEEEPNNGQSESSQSILNLEISPIENPRPKSKKRVLNLDSISFQPEITKRQQSI